MIYLVAALAALAASSSVIMAEELMWVVSLVGVYSEYGGGGSLALSGHPGSSSSLLWDVDVDAEADPDGPEVSVA